jgi:hypothetical protein
MPQDVSVWRWADRLLIWNILHHLVIQRFALLESLIVLVQLCKAVEAFWLSDALVPSKILL